MNTITLEVRDMSCTGCEERIGAVLRRVEVREVAADHTTGRVEIRVGDDPGESPPRPGGTPGSHQSMMGYTTSWLRATASQSRR